MSDRVITFTDGMSYEAAESETDAESVQQRFNEMFGHFFEADGTLKPEYKPKPKRKSLLNIESMKSGDGVLRGFIP